MHPERLFRFVHPAAICMAGVDSDFSGDHTAGDIPLPIPNRADKPRRADGTLLETVRESRSLPGFF